MQPSSARLVLTDAKGNVDLSQAPSIPDLFLKSLLAFDKDLFVLWSPTRQRYLVHQCVEHNATGAKINQGHTQLCRSVYVVICQDKDGVVVPLNERVLSTLREMRAESERFGGDTERGLKNYLQHSNNVDHELESKRESAVKDLYAHNQKFNRISFNRLGLMYQHLFTAPNK
jgi:hypothetical protein